MSEGAARPVLRPRGRHLPRPQGHPRDAGVRRAERDQRPAVYEARPDRLPQPADLSGRGIAAAAAADLPLRLAARRAAVLGPSESVGAFGDLFETVDSKWKIFRRKETLGDPAHPRMELPLEPPRRAAEEHAGPAAGGASIRHTVTQVERLLLARFAPASLVVDERGTIVYIHGRTGAYLEPAEGQPRTTPGDGPPGPAAPPWPRPCCQAVAEKLARSVRENLRVKTNGDFSHVTVSVTRIDDPESIRGLLLITIQPAAQAPRVTAVSAGKKSRPEDASATAWRSWNANCDTSRSL